MDCYVHFSNTACHRELDRSRARRLDVVADGQADQPKRGLAVNEWTHIDSTNRLITHRTQGKSAFLFLWLRLDMPCCDSSCWFGRGSVFARTPPPSPPHAACLAVTPLLRFFVKSFLDKPSASIVRSKTVPSRRLDYTSDVCVDAYRTFSESRGDHFMHACLRRLNHYGNTIVSAV